MHVDIMKAITIRKLPRELQQIIRKKANEKALSINKTVISLLEESTGMAQRRRKGKILYHELDNLAGRWSSKEASEFEKVLSRQRGIDAELWK